MPLGNQEFCLAGSDKTEIIISTIEPFCGYRADFYKKNTIKLESGSYTQFDQQVLIEKELNFEECMRRCEEWAKNNMNIYCANKNDWIEKNKKVPASREQIEWLKKLKSRYRYKKDITKADASTELGILFALKNKESRNNSAIKEDYKKQSMTYAQERILSELRISFTRETTRYDAAILLEEHFRSFLN